MKSIESAKMSNKTIQVMATDKSWPRIYALPSAPLNFKEQHLMTENFIIFGPYPRDNESNLLLLRNEESQKKKNRQTTPFKTRCLWIYCDSLKLIEENIPGQMMVAWGRDPTDCQEVTELRT